MQNNPSMEEKGTRCIKISIIPFLYLNRETVIK